MPPVCPFMPPARLYTVCRTPGRFIITRITFAYHRYFSALYTPAATRLGRYTAPCLHTCHCTCRAMPASAVMPSLLFLFMIRCGFDWLYSPLPCNTHSRYTLCDTSLLQLRMRITYLYVWMVGLVLFAITLRDLSHALLILPSACTPTAFAIHIPAPCCMYGHAYTTHLPAAVLVTYLLVSTCTTFILYLHLPLYQYYYYTPPPYYHIPWTEHYTHTYSCRRRHGGRTFACCCLFLCIVFLLLFFCDGWTCGRTLPAISLTFSTPTWFHR